MKMQRQKHVKIFGKLIESNTNSIHYKGKRLKTEPRIMKLLMLLHASRGKVVKKNELLQAVWKDTVVTDDSLTKAISKLRGVLDNETGPSAIETINGIGYMLRKPTIWFQLRSHGTTIVLTGLVIFLIYVLMGSGLVEWVFSLKSHLMNP